MSDIVRLPGGQSWDELEEEFATILRKAGVPRDGIVWVLTETRLRVGQAAQLPEATANMSVHEQMTFFLFSMILQLNLALTDLYLCRSNATLLPAETTAQILQFSSSNKPAN